MRLGSFVIVFAAVFVASVVAETKEFSIRPSIDDSVTVSDGKYTCTFSWTDCTGGSSEVLDSSLPFSI
jgi:hypothetical protein